MKVEIMSKRGTKIMSLNRRRAIREACLNCSAWFAPDVKNCIFQDCQLYPFRMGTGKQNPTERAKAIRQYCLWCMGGQSKEISRCTIPKCPLYAYRNVRTDNSINIESLAGKEHIGVPKKDKNEKA